MWAVISDNVDIKDLLFLPWKKKVTCYLKILSAKNAESI
jgi:hypothetical protein